MSGTSRRNWLRVNAAAMGWILAGLPGAARAATRSGSGPLVGSGPVRLCYNENSYGPSPKALAAIADHAAQGNRYALNLQSDLRRAIAKTNQVPADQVVLGSGSSEILALATSLAARNGPGHILMASPTFAMWLTPAAQLGVETRAVPLDTDYRHDLPAMAAAVTDKTRMVYLCNPANPTGTTVPEPALREFVRTVGAKTLVVVDEAYFEYVGAGSTTGLVKEVPNLLVARTFSKLYGLAGLRVGYGIGQMAGSLAARQGWPNIGVSSLSMAAALASLGDDTYVHGARDRNKQAMDFTLDVLRELKLNYVPPSASFVLFDVTRFKGDLSDALGKRGVQVRSWEMQDKRWCRVSMGTMGEMQTFAQHLKTVLTS